MWKKLALIAGAVVAVLAVVVALQPSTFTIERSRSIAAPPEVIAAHIQSLRAMDAWSPWVKMDPGMKVSYAGPEAGVGASSSWEGPQMGQGRLTVTGVKPDREIEMRLEMLAPMKATNRIVFTLVPAGASTRVTWHMDGANGFVAKAFSLVMDMDEMVGGPFEQGLLSLEKVAVADAGKRRADLAAE